MTKMNRTLVSFIGFIINYYLIMVVFKDIKITTEQNVLVWLVFIVSIITSLVSWDASYLFASMATLYVFFLIVHSPFSMPAIISLIVCVATLYIMNKGIPEFKVKMSFLENITGNLSIFSRNIAKKKARSRIALLAKSKPFSFDLSDEQINSFISVEKEVVRIHSFFDGSDKALEQTLSGTKQMVFSLLEEYSRLILREAHLDNLISNSGKSALEVEVQRLKTRIADMSDAVQQKEMQTALEMKEKRYEEISKLEMCQGRVSARKSQIEETVFSTFNRLNSLKFADIQTLDASKNLLNSQVLRFKDELDEIEKSIIAVEKI
ncbi:MAG: hypothetical protein HQM10_00720 [Candidatus Riflebacteria bacterium]|nr:hypothetical protein [Candidatus Riflebacteria bacterium]